MHRPRRLPLEALAPYLLEPSSPPAPLSWLQVFGNDRPVEVEVGFGKGQFLVTAAQLHPEVNYLGIEIARKYQLFTATRVAKRGLQNVRLVKADARFFLRGWAASASCRAVHVYFPDPWWKKRHLKRRVFEPGFVAECARILEPGGRLYVATDVEEYFQVIAGLLQAQAGLGRIETKGVVMQASEQGYFTNFERKAREQGRSIWTAVYERRGSDDQAASTACK